jgi:hypothetical protein
MPENLGIEKSQNGTSKIRNQEAKWSREKHELG